MKPITLLFVLSLSLLFVRCNDDCKSEQLGELHFTPEELAIVPYNGTETLIFVDSLNDSIVYYFLSRETKVGTTLYQNYNMPASNCPGNYYIPYNNLTTFNGQNNNSNLRIGLGFTNPFEGEKMNTISISIKKS